MAITTYPLNNVLYTAEDAEIYNATRTSGIFANDDFKAEVTGEDNNVTIREGLAWIHNSRFAGKSVALKVPETLNLSLADNTYDRIDAIVLKYDSAENKTTLEIKKGVAQSVPKPPQVVQTESVYELHLYHILRKAGAITITADVVTDLRDNPAFCGKMYDNVTPKDFVTQISRGGTGAKTESEARKNLGLGNVNNTADSVKRVAYADNSNKSNYANSAGSANKAGNVTGIVGIGNGGTGATTVQDMKSKFGIGATIIAKGANSNGDWWKFDNGLMICSYHGSWNGSIGLASGSLYLGLDNWTFPQPFYSVPSVAVGQAKWGTGTSWGSCGDVHENYASIRFYDNFKRDRGTIYMNLMAIGRWK